MHSTPYLFDSGRALHSCDSRQLRLEEKQGIETLRLGRHPAGVAIGPIEVTKRAFGAKMGTKGREMRHLGAFCGQVDRCLGQVEGKRCVPPGHDAPVGTSGADGTAASSESGVSRASVNGSRKSMSAKGLLRLTVFCSGRMRGRCSGADDQRPGEIWRAADRDCDVDLEMVRLS